MARIIWALSLPVYIKVASLYIEEVLIMFEYDGDIYEDEGEYLET